MAHKSTGTRPYAGHNGTRCPHSIMWGDRTDVMHSGGIRKCERCQAIADTAGTDDWDIRQDSPTRYSVMADGRTLAFIYYNGTGQGGWQAHGAGKIHYTPMLAAEIEVYRSFRKCP